MMTVRNLSGFFLEAVIIVSWRFDGGVLLRYTPPSLETGSTIEDEPEHRNLVYSGVQGRLSPGATVEEPGDETCRQGNPHDAMWAMP
jgi:hypothetical protein